MSSWPSAKARRVFAALKRIGWRHDRTVGSHKIMKKDGWADYPFSFHDSEELGSAILAKISKKTPSTPRPVMARIRRVVERLRMSAGNALA
jgi:predicted RNA binding protein YcfA (HicA-like mRNA interferase family)